MKYLLLFFFSVICFSCYKVDTYTSQSFNYTLDSISDIVLAINDTAQIGIQATLLSGNATGQPVRLTFSGLPKNVTVNHADTSFGLSNNFSLTIQANNATVGSYPVRIDESTSLGIRTHHILVIIAPCKDRARSLSGNYFWSTGPTTSPDSSNSTISSILDMPNRIFIPNVVHGTHKLLYADIICGTNDIIIPLQKVDSFTVYGRGAFSVTTNSYDNIKTTTIGLLDTFTKAGDTTYWFGQCSRDSYY